MIAKPDPKTRTRSATCPTTPRRGGHFGLLAMRESGKVLFASSILPCLPHRCRRPDAEGPHLVDIGKGYSRAELVESILKPRAKIAQGY